MIDGRDLVIELDPDGTQPGGWLHVIVEAATGAVYAAQCAGVANELRSCEGYLVPVGGLKMDPAAGRIDTAGLRAVFHDGRVCLGAGEPLPAERLAALEAWITQVPFWIVAAHGGSLRQALELDRGRLDEIAEAWVPVRTPLGRAVLVWKNCD